MDRAILCLIICLGISVGWHSTPAYAQEDSDMGRPPPPDAPPDFEEIDDEMMEDEGFRPPPPPPPVNSGMNMPAPGDFRPPGGGPNHNPAPPSGGNFGGGNFGGGGGAKGPPAKVKFKVVDGEYWEKGKKRSRGEKLRAE